VPERDGQREETFARFRNGEPELGHLIYRQRGMNRPECQPHLAGRKVVPDEPGLDYQNDGHRYDQG
jgi:hypothetical protein